MDMLDTITKSSGNPVALSVTGTFVDGSALKPTNPY